MEKKTEELDWNRFTTRSNQETSERMFEETDARQTHKLNKEAQDIIHYFDGLKVSEEDIEANIAEPLEEVDQHLEKIKKNLSLYDKLPSNKDQQKLYDSGITAKPSAFLKVVEQLRAQSIQLKEIMTTYSKYNKSNKKGKKRASETPSSQSSENKKRKSRIG